MCVLVSDVFAADGADPKATSGDKKVVCYLTSWSKGRKSPYNFTPDKMDPFICTHIIYAFASFGKDYNIAPSDPEADITNRKLGTTSEFVLMVFKGSNNK